MQIQKLVFLANGFALALLNEPITYHNIHAWKWGPVFPQIYKSFSKFGASSIDCIAPCDESIPESGDESDVVNSVWQNYGNKTGAQLSSITHEVGSPWDETWKTNQFGIIDPDRIKAYYTGKIA